jgi:hypothetical protein
VVERLLLKKKKECEREEEKGGIREGGISRRTPGWLAPLVRCRAPTSMASFNPPWQGPIHVYKKGASDPCTLQCTKGVGHPSALAWSKYGISFPGGLFVKKVF